MPQHSEFIPATWWQAYRLRRLLCRLTRRHQAFIDGHGYRACARCYQAVDDAGRALGYRVTYPDGNAVE